MATARLVATMYPVRVSAADRDEAGNENNLPVS